MNGRGRWIVWGLAGLGLAAWAVGRRRSRSDEMSFPERAVERGIDAAGVVAETTAELTRPPGSDGPLP